MKHIKLLLIPILISIIGALSSCIDSKYDLDKLPSQIIIAGDSMTLPIGYTDTATMKNFIEDQNVQYIEVRDGIYYINYKDSTDLPIPTKQEFRINDILESSSAALTKAPLANVGVDYTMPADYSSTFALSNNFPLITNSIILRIDSVELSNSIGENIFTLTIKLDQITLVSGSYNVNLNVHLPAGFILENTNGSATGNPFAIALTKTDNSPIIQTFKLRRFTKSTAPLAITYDGTVKFNSGSKIKYNSNSPALTISIGVANFYIDAFKGQINLHSKTTIVKENIKSIYSIFKSNSDVVSFYNPSFIIDTKSNFTIPITTTFNISTKGGTPTVPETLSFEMDPPLAYNALKLNHFVISNIKPAQMDIDTKSQTMDLRSFIKAKPDSIIAKIDFQTKSGSGTLSSPHFIRSNSIGKVNYRLELPISFTNDFVLTYSDTITDVFTDDIKKQLFNSGSVYLRGDIVTTIPLNAEISIAIMAEGYAQPNIVLSNKTTYKANKDKIVNRAPINFTISATDLKNMLHPRHLSFSIRITSDNTLQGIALKANDFIFLENLRVTKKGGLSVDL